MNKILLIVLLLIASPAFSATYYIDYTGGSDSDNGISESTPWKRHPYMQGWSGSYSHSEGDTFIFKGGVTWPSATHPMNITGSGSGVGSEDTYTVDETWYSGGSYTRPVLDGEGLKIATPIQINGASYVKIHGLKITDVGVSGTTSNLRGIQTINGTLEGIIVDDVEIITRTNHGITFHYNSTRNITHGFKITNCKMSHMTNFIESGVTNPNPSYKIDGVTITGNEFFDPSDQLINGDHGDGIHIFSVGEEQYVYTNVTVAYNKWYGDWAGSDASTSNTAMIYFEGVVSTGEIYNNHMTFSNTSTGKVGYLFSPGPITVRMQDSGKIYNNTIDCSAIPYTPGGNDEGCSKGIVDNGINDIEIYGNIIHSVNYGVSAYSTSIEQTNFNICYNCNNFGLTKEGGTTIYSSLATWQSGTANGDNSSEADPKMVSPGVGGDISLQADSPAVDMFTSNNPTSVFSDDFLGNHRPAGDYWDVGAYEYGADSNPGIYFNQPGISNFIEATGEVNFNQVETP